MNETIENYILAHSDSEPQALKKIYRDANLHLVHGHMTSGPLQGRVLKMFVRMIRPERILEIGTFAGYSALCMAEGLDGKGEIHTIEANDELIPFIKDHWKESEISAPIKLHIGDALDIMKSMPPKSFDLIFIDADKREYPAYYPIAKNLLCQGGFMLVDNTLWYGNITDASRNDPQTRGIREFNRIVKDDDTVEKVILPLRDGLTIIRKKSN